MGRTPKPLTILALDGVEQWPEWESLKAQGHRVVTTQDLRINTVSFDDLDGIVGPKCWRMTTPLRKHLPVCVQAMRKLKYPKEEK